VEEEGEETMSLLSDIQEDATDSRVDILKVLRKAKILAAKLNNPEFDEWIEHELNGYENRENLPNYRILPAQIKGNFLSPQGHQLRETGIPESVLPPELEGWGYEVRLAHPISLFASLRASAKEADDHEIRFPWPPALALQYGSRLYRGMQCISAWQAIPAQALDALMETVRNRILSFSLEIWKEAPDAGEAAPKVEPVPQERVRHIYLTTIFASGTGNVAVGSSDFTQANYASVQQGDANSLSKYLSDLGIDSDDVNAIVRDVESPDPVETKIGKAKTWLVNLAMKAATKAGESSVSAVVGLAAKALFTYLGVPGG
jgi:hypothetical protein